MSGDYKKLLTKKKKKYCDTKTMGVNIDKNEYYEITLSNSAHPENIIHSVKKAFTILELIVTLVIISLIATIMLPNIKSQMNKVDDASYYLAYKTAVDISQNVISQYNWNEYLKNLTSIDNYETIAEVKPSLIDMLKTHFNKNKNNLYANAFNTHKKLNDSISTLNPLVYSKANALLDNAMICYGTCNGGTSEVQENACGSNWVLTRCTCTSGYEWNDGAKICQKSCPSNQILCTKSDTCITCGKNTIFNQDNCQCECPEGYQDDNNNGDCTPEPTKWLLCPKIKEVYQIIDEHTNCSTNYNSINNASTQGNFSTVKTNIVMNNGLMIYITSDTPVSIPSLQNKTGSTTISKENYGFTIYIDINGKRGKGLLYEDVFPFYLTLAGKTIPAYPMSILDINNQNLPSAQIKPAGGNNSEHLSLNVVYDDFSENKLHTKLIMKNANFRSAACSIGYVDSATKYCNGKLPYNICNEKLSYDNIAHNCRFWVQRPFRFFR